jgi:hypothetical protein
MGFAKVISGGELGRYTIELDYGASTRTAILAAVDVLIGQLTTKLAAVQVNVTAADEKEAAQQVKVAEAQAEYIAQSQSVAPGSPAPSSTVFKFEVGKLTQLQIISGPLRLQKSALDFDLAQTRRRRDYWQAFNPIETREAWCTDYTEDRAAGAYVATMDIPGESALILLAPGARAWQAGDGTVSVAVKLASIASATAALAKVTAQLGETSALLAIAVAAETALKAALTAASAAYLADPTAANLNAQTLASEAFSAKALEVARLRQRITRLTAIFVKAQGKLAAANALIASSSPAAGDGILTARELMSPEQAFFNAAILPGWQKDKPTYRWGTITGLNFDANTADVTLFDARSSAQRLSVNKVGSLAGVPVQYMTCNADAFEVGDNCIVRFNGQSWDSPVVIGFLDNPKRCISWPTVELKVLFTAPGSHTDSFRSWMILQTNAACGVVGLLGDRYQSTPATAFLAFDPAGPYFPTPAPSASISSTIPADVNLGPTQIGFGQVPGGGSPGIHQAPTAATFPNNFAILRTERAFSTVTLPESCPTEDDPSPTIVSGPYFNAQPIGVYDDYTNSISASFVSHGPARLQDYLPTMPTISVTISGKTRAYACSASRGGASSFEWILTFNKP